MGIMGIFLIMGTNVPLNNNKLGILQGFLIRVSKDYYKGSFIGASGLWVRLLATTLRRFPE